MIFRQTVKSPISFNTIKGFNANDVGHRLFVTLGGGSTQCIYDNLRLTVSDPPDTYVANFDFEYPWASAGGWSPSATGWTGVGESNSSGVIAMADKFSGTPAYTNLATEGLLQVMGPLLCEIDDLTTNAAVGSVVLSQTVPAPTYISCSG